MKELMGDPYIGTAKMAKNTKMSAMDRDEKRVYKKKQGKRKPRQESIKQFMQRRNSMEGEA